MPVADRRGSAIWPTPEELKDLVVEGPRSGRVLLGRLAATNPDTGWLRFLKPTADETPALAAEPCRGVLVIGATRSGKSSSILSPAVINWDGPVITTSIRDDVLAATWESREAAGCPILVYNPKLEGDYGSSTWSPLVAAMGDKPWVGARRMADLLVEASGLVDGGANRREPFWTAAAATYLGPLLLAGAQLGSSMKPVMGWLHTADKVETDEQGHRMIRARDEIRKLLREHDAALRTIEGVWTLHERTRSSIYLTARTALAAYDDEDVLTTCGDTGPDELPEINPDTVLGTPEIPAATLYIVSPPTNRRYFAPLFTALLTSILEAAYSRTAGAKMLDPPILLALDEVANIAPIAELPAYASTAAGAGIQLITVLQDLGQAEGIWGPTGNAHSSHEPPRQADHGRDHGPRNLEMGAGDVRGDRDVEADRVEEPRADAVRPNRSSACRC